MKKRFVLIFGVLFLSLFSIACTGSDAGINLGEEFALSPGEGAKVGPENMEITFLEITEDSRCATGVTCVWAGQVTARVRILLNGRSEELLLTEPGLTDSPAATTFNNHLVSYRIEPYPEIDRHIGPEEYRLLLVVSLAE